VGTTASLEDRQETVAIFGATTNRHVHSDLRHQLRDRRCTVKGAWVRNEKKQAAYAEVNLQKLSTEMAQGGGEYLNAFASLMGANDEASKKAFISMTSRNTRPVPDGEHGLGDDAAQPPRGWPSIPSSRRSKRAGSTTSSIQRADALTASRPRYFPRDNPRVLLALASPRSRGAFAAPPAMARSCRPGARAAPVRRAKWLRLLHYSERGGLAQRGRRGELLPRAGRPDEPGAELEADLTVFSHPSPPPASTRNALPARYHAQGESVLRPRAPDGTGLPDSRLAGRDRRGGGVVVFASAFLNNPASMYGHTFLRLHRRGGATPARLHDQLRGDPGHEQRADVHPPGPERLF